MIKHEFTSWAWYIGHALDWRRTPNTTYRSIYVHITLIWSKRLSWCPRCAQLRWLRAAGLDAHLTTSHAEIYIFRLNGLQDSPNAPTASAAMAVQSWVSCAPNTTCRSIYINSYMAWETPGTPPVSAALAVRICVVRWLRAAGLAAHLSSHAEISICSSSMA